MGLQFPDDVLHDPCLLVWNVDRYWDWARQLEWDILVWAGWCSVTVRVTSRYRTCQEQRDLYRAGKTAAGPGTSQHEHGLAFDIVPIRGFEQYNATRAQAFAWLVDVAIRFGAGQALNEGTHVHVGVFSNDAWRRFLTARDVFARL